MSVITLPSSGRVGGFKMRRSQSALRTFTGIQQITEFPANLWELMLEVPPQKGDNLRLWAAAMFELASMENVFAMGPYWYTGPSTGYTGTPPLVAGASQVGLTLDVDGLDFGVPILKRGDFISFDTTSAKGATNRQLIPITADVSSNGSGLATFSLMYPIRQSPLNDAAVEIFSPTTYFCFDESLGGVDTYELIYAGFSMKATEKVFP